MLLASEAACAQFMIPNTCVGFPGVNWRFVAVHPCPGVDACVSREVGFGANDASSRTGWQETATTPGAAFSRRLLSSS